jgi:assimilatory nitrate reductase catalytic subunit
VTDTHCPYCALQCAMSVSAGPSADGPVEVAPRDFPTNRGGLCQKGWTSAEVLRAGDRLTHPWVRRADGLLHPATWDEALDRVTREVTVIQAEHGRDAVGVFGGGGLTNEKAYQLGKFARVALRTPYIDYNGRFCMSSAAAAGNRAFGLDRGLPFPLADLGDADAVLLLGSNVADTMPPLVQHLAGVRARGGLVVVDPRRSATAGLAADGAGLHLQPVPGTDLVLLLGLLHVLVADDRVDRGYLEARTEGWAAVRRSVSEWWPARVADETGVPERTLRQAAGVLAGARNAYVLTGRGVEQHTHGTDTVSAAVNLALALGLPGRPGSGYGCLTGQGNGQGGREHGQKADQLPGYRSIEDPAARAHVAGVWGVDPDTLPGKGVPAVELLKREGLRALFVHGSNPVVSAPDATAVRRRLEALDLLVVCDVVPSETAAIADVLLPVTQWAEEEGTMTNLEGRVLRRRRAVDPPGEVRDELSVLAELARRLGCAVHFGTDAREVFEELGRASSGGVADYAGIDYDRLDAGEALHWPCPAADHTGTPRLFLDRFATPSGRARMTAVRPGRPADDLRTDAPLFLVTGRLLAQYQSGAQTRRVPTLNRSADGPFVEMHPQLASRLGAEEGDLVTVTSRRGATTAPARVSRGIRPDTVFMPFHWDGSANVLTNDATDPVSGMPDFKVCAVSVVRA